MSQPIISPQPTAQSDPEHPVTAEIPVAATVAGTQQLPRIDVPGAEVPAETPVQPTGPVDFVPGLPGVGTLPPPPKAEEPKAPKQPRTPQDRAALIGTGLAALSLVLLELGLVLGFGAASFWSTVPLWSAFATLATVLGLLPSVARFAPGARLRSDASWRIAAGGLTGVAVFWVLVVLPGVDSNRGFVLTAALAALGAALWVAPARRS
ncbi:hypothetical protein [Geodermatophilus ruber]|uniref:Uncharacterized protein n=1 Tax=Geodermatophilus ruber TaxID=504800 RepID=A0A1I4JC52_9ACTN|nr:hypothetical protein [Geodermatophilus ruber]SFL64110.1 hypothetical protein SAMN04488085_114143 [Geodermatophilus ruber]